MKKVELVVNILTQNAAAFDLEKYLEPGFELSLRKMFPVRLG